jgi:hypothetical protein
MRSSIVACFAPSRCAKLGPKRQSSARSARPRRPPQRSPGVLDSRATPLGVMEVEQGEEMINSHRQASHGRSGPLMANLACGFRRRVGNVRCAPVPGQWSPRRGVGLGGRTSPRSCCPCLTACEARRYAALERHRRQRDPSGAAQSQTKLVRALAGASDNPHNRRIPIS